jgi:signal transduction histidine kinase
MEAFCIVLIVLILFLSARLFFLHRAIGSASDQMEEIESYPKQNRNLKTSFPDKKLERLLRKINEVYLARQQERIVYQKRETQIRQEIENISHDLRTPLTSILGYVSFLKEDDLKSDERGEYVDIIQKRAKILQGFIQDFYEISRIEADDYPLLLEVISVQAQLKEALVAYYHEFEQKQLELTAELEERPALIIADKIQFNRILNNLIQNALKYSSKQFKVRQYMAHGCCFIQFINDTGVTSQEELSLIFNRFYTGDQSRGNQSSGLGLTITKLLVEKMKGQIDARMEQDRFIIEIMWKCNI